MASYPRAVGLPSGLQPTTLTPAETARYTRDMLESLRKIAVGQNQGLLAHLLGLAAIEAKVAGTLRVPSAG